MPLGHFSALISNRDITTVYTCGVLDSESGRFLRQHILTLESPEVTMYTTCFNIKEFCIFTQCTLHMIRRIAEVISVTALVGCLL